MNEAGFDEAVLWLGVLLLKAVMVWAGVVLTLGVWRPTAGLARRLTPRAFRFLIVAGVSGAMTTTTAQAGELDGLRLPDRMPSTLAGTTHLVKAGDSLWGIAAERLPVGAQSPLIAHETARWYDANRVVVGPDPDLIRPGQQLRPPDGAS